MRRAGYVERKEEMRSTNYFFPNLPVKRPLWRKRRTWENNIKMELKNFGVRTTPTFMCFRIGSDGRLLFTPSSKKG
jgi:hypothetical protein